MIAVCVSTWSIAGCTFHWQNEHICETFWVIVTTTKGCFRVLRSQLRFGCRIRSSGCMNSPRVLTKMETQMITENAQKYLFRHTSVSCDSAFQTSTSAACRHTLAGTTACVSTSQEATTACARPVQDAAATARRSGASDATERTGNPASTAVLSAPAR